ncbi:hypothetical protein [Aquihabitans sp. McL0605]|uniref:hypothetical protein n=1 Tax=Aquihabitans sp. McL0605 TaxID=3415671 RepID=UPI003CF3711F
MSNRGVVVRSRIRRVVGDHSVQITDGELVVLMACNLVTTVGLSGDISRHFQNIGNLNGDFLSGWHLVLYGGVTAVALWLGVGALRRGPAFVTSAGTTTVGFLILAFGGVADAAWHARFGTEANIEALVSPPHLMVFAGLTFLLSSPIVVLWRRPARRLGLVASLVALSSVVSTVLVISLFTGYLSPLAGGMSITPGYIEPLVGESPIDYDQVRGLAIAVWTVAVLVAAFTVILVRFRPVPGLLWLSVFLCGAPALALTSWTVIKPEIVGYAVAGLVLEVMVALTGKPTLGRGAAAVTGALLGSMLWAATFAMLRSDGRLGWTIDLWGGTIILSGLIGAAVASLVALPVPTGDALVDSPLGPRPA